MRSTSTYISITNPCHENWDSMDATKQGAFCHSCRKEVIDFSAMTDREVIEYLNKHKTSCGRFRKDQVDRKLVKPQIESGIKWRALLLSALSLISYRSALAHTTSTSPSDQSQTQPKEKKDTIATLPPQPVTICGKVVDELGNPVPQASIQVHYYSGRFNGNGAVSDSAGEFQVDLSREEMAQRPHLIVERDSFSTYQSVDKNALQQNVTIILKKPLPMCMLGGMTVVNSYSSGFSLFRLTKKLREKYAVTNKKIIIVGLVLGANKDSIAGASVRVIDSAGRFEGEGAVSDSNGSYTIILDPEEMKVRQFHLQVSYADYIPVTIKLTQRNLQHATTWFYYKGFKGSESLISYATNAPPIWAYRLLLRIRHFFHMKPTYHRD